MRGETEGSGQASAACGALRGRGRGAKIFGIALAAMLLAGGYIAWAAIVSVPLSIITTFAGGGAGDGKSALLASVGVPTDVATDAAGNLYVADQQHSRIRKIDANGIVTTVAGIGIDGYSGDGGPATAAMLNGPTGILFDATGNLYIADTVGQRVRKIATNGIITTVAGNGAFAFGGDGGPATNAQLAYPVKLAIAADGSLYIADSANNRIRKVDANGIITTIAGTGTAGFGGDGGMATAAQLNSPRGLVFDSSGNLYFADSGNQRVRKIDGAGVITTIAGTGAAGDSGDGGAATAAQLRNPHDVDFDSHGNFYIADAGNNRIRKIDANGIITTAAGGQPGSGNGGDGGAATAASLLFPQGLGIDSSDVLYIADSIRNTVRRVDTAGIITTVAGNGQPTCCDGDPATTAALNLPSGLAVDAGGSVYVADTADNQIRKVDANGIIATFAGTGSSTFFGDGGQATAAGLFSPQGIAIGAAGAAYIADTGHQRVRKIDANGIITTVAGTGNAGYAGDGQAATGADLATPSDVAVDGDGNLYIVDTSNHAIRKVDSAGIITTVAGSGTAGLAGDGGPAAQAQLNTPRAMAVDANTGDLYIADTNNHRIRKIDASGVITTVAGTSAGFAGDNGPAIAAKLRSPYGVAVDGGGNLYVADTDNNLVRRVGTDGIITHLAGVTSAGFDGDGGPAATALLNSPIRVAVDAHGNVFVSDQKNNRIRVIGAGHSVGGTVSGLAGSGLTLGLNAGAQTLPVSANGSFTFPTALASGAGYDVSVQAQPSLPQQTCTVTNGSGTISDADVSNVAVSCVTTAIMHEITAVAGPGGTISPNGTQTVADGLILEFTVTPDTGYVIAGVTGCGVSLVKATYATAPVTADCTVSATFAPANSPVDGACGSDNGKSLLAPPANLCTTGTPSVVQGNGPWTWTCQGSNGGGTANCSAQKATAPSATTLSLAPNPAKVGQNVIATVIVNESAPNTAAAARLAAAVGGTVTVSGGGRSCSAALGNGGASCVLVFDTPGSYSIVANYSGDATHAASSDTRTLTVNAVGGGNALATAPALDRWALMLMLLSLLAVAARRYRGS